MSYEVFPPNVIGPSYPLSKQMVPRILKSTFGDGYSQEVPDGINFMLATWSLKWEVLTTEEKKIIETFLVKQAGYKTFLWTDNTSTQYRIKCRDWSFSEDEPTIFSLQATFTQVPM